MKKLIIYNHELGKTYQYPNGSIATPERIIEDFPAVAMFPHIIETDESGQMFLSIQNLAMARTMHSIDAGLSDDEAVQAIQDILNAPVVENTEPTPEERIASALEFQNLLAL